MSKDVHTEHCCIYHGCKYSYTKVICPVVAKAKVQSYPCEECDEAKQEFEEAKSLKWFGM